MDTGAGGNIALTHPKRSRGMRSERGLNDSRVDIVSFLGIRYLL
jgi:hypothetical protein